MTESNRERWAKTEREADRLAAHDEREAILALVLAAYEEARVKAESWYRDGDQERTHHHDSRADCLQALAAAIRARGGP